MDLPEPGLGRIASTDAHPAVSTVRSFYGEDTREMEFLLDEGGALEKMLMDESIRNGVNDEELLKRSGMA